MNNLFTKFKILFAENKKIIIPLIPLVFFILIFIFVLSLSAISPQPTTQNGQEVPSPTQANENTKPTFSQQPTVSPEQQDDNPVHGDENVILYENDQLLEKKEILSDGSTKYSLSSSVQSRPNVIITRDQEQNIVFERTVIEQTGKPILLADYLSFFGQPERTIAGSQFYGTSAQIYILASQGVAYIAIPQTNRVLELHTFAPMSVDEYLAKFGDQN